MQRGASRVGELFLHQIGGIGEQFLVFVLDAGLVNLPHAATLAVIDDAATVRREVDGTLLLGRIGDLLGGVVVHRGHIHVAMHDKGYFLAAGRDLDGRSPVFFDVPHQFLLDAVGGNGNVDTLGLAALAQGIDFTVVAIAERTVTGHREETYGIILVVGELYSLPANGNNRIACYRE